MGERERDGSKIKETRKMLKWLGGGREEGAVSLSRLTTESVINNNTNLHLLQTDGRGTKP